MTRNYSLFVKDILNAIENIEDFVKDMDYEDFLRDDMAKSAVIWKLQIIGEATKNIPKPIRSKYKELPWVDMAKMRDKISHLYFGINYRIVWGVIKKRLPQIKPIIKSILEDLSREKLSED